MMGRSVKEIDRGMHDLLHWGHAVQIKDIPDHVVTRAVIVLGDDLASMIAADAEAEVRCLKNEILMKDVPRESTIFLSDAEKTDRYNACILNGAAANWCELDEGYRKVTCHAGLYSIPALLAEAEAVGATIAEVLRALIVAYEIVTRFAKTWTFPSLIMHPHALFSSIGSCSAIATLKLLEQNQFYNALTNAVTLVGIGPFNHASKGALIENMWAGIGSFNGMKAVEWSGCGISGMKESFSDVLEECLGAKANPEELTRDLGTEWGIFNGYNKMYGCCQYAHSTIEACLQLLKQIKGELSIDDIAKIDVEIHKLGLGLNDESPKTTLGAKFSIPHIVASTLVSGNASIETFGSKSLENEQVKMLRTKVHLKELVPEKLWPNDRGARVLLTLSDGEELHSRCDSAKGGPDNPYSDEEILQKIDLISKKIFPEMIKMIRMLYTDYKCVSKERWRSFVGKMTDGGKSR